MTRADVFRRVLGVALLCLVGSSVWSRYLGWPATAARVLPVVIGVCVAYWAGVVLGRRVSRGRGALLAVAVTVLGSMLAGAFSLPDPKGRQGLEVYTDSIVQWLGTLIGSTVPTVVTPDSVTAATIVAGYLTLIACLTVTTAAPAVSLLPSSLLFITTLAFTQGSPISVVPFAVAYLLALGLALSLWPSSRAATAVADGEAFSSVELEPVHGRFKRTLMVLLVTALIAGLAVAGGLASGLGSLRTPFDPHRSSGYRTEDETDAVRTATAWQTVERDTVKTLFTLKPSSPPPAVWWAILEGYDGSTWGTTQPYDRITGEIPYPGIVPANTLPVNSQVTTTDNLVGAWLPTPYRATGISSGPFLSNPAGGLSVSGGDAKNLSYSTISRITALTDPAQLVSATPLSKADGYTATALPGQFPIELATIASGAMSIDGTDFEKLTALAEYTSNPDEYQIDPTSTDTGIGYQELITVMTETGTGTQAQFATAFALMARSQGYASRISVGYSLPPNGTVTTRNVLVWAEIGFKDIGWIPFAAAPGDLTAGVPVPVAKPRPKPKPSASPSPTTATPTPTPSPTPTPKQTQQHDSWLDLRVAGTILVLVLALIGWPLYVSWRRVRVRGSLHAADPAADAIGAWVWVRTGADHLGRPMSDTESPARVVRDRRAPNALAAVAEHANRALYSPEPLTAGGAKDAWRAGDAYLRQIRAEGGIRARLRWVLLPVGRPERWVAADDPAQSEVSRGRSRRDTELMQ
ncbi:MAG TPA: transglutaminase-like domain-containing protein [Actinomycetota bacterium]|nr:transglutaminase-like domain-containing protein [Actinomycetota bacterium]